MGSLEALALVQLVELDLCGHGAGGLEVAEAELITAVVETEDHGLAGDDGIAVLIQGQGVQHGISAVLCLAFWARFRSFTTTPNNKYNFGNFDVIGGTWRKSFQLGKPKRHLRAIFLSLKKKGGGGLH